MKEKIKKYFQENKEQLKKEIVSLTTEMVKHKTVNVLAEKLAEHPYMEARGDEYKVANIVERELKKLGIKYDKFAAKENRPNIIGKFGQNKSGKRLLLASHMDIVPAGEGWDTDPFEPVVKDDKIYGRGTLDNKGPLACAIIAAKALKEVVGEENYSGQLQIAALCDEEVQDPKDGYCGLQYLLKEKKLDATHVIAPDAGMNMKKIDITEKGRTILKIKSFGKQAHGAWPEKGINAIYRMAKLLDKLENIKMKYKEHDLLGKPSLNVGEIQGGAAPNIVPGECEVFLDIRTVPGQKTQDILDQIKAFTKDIAPDDFKFEVLLDVPPHALDADNELVKIIQKNTNDLLGFSPVIMGMAGRTYAKEFTMHNIPAVAFGPGDDELFHVANENVSITELVDFACLISLCALDF